MKSFKLFILSAIAFAFTTAASAQSKTETFKVSGECGMCKNKIEGAAKKAGASSASWSEETKELTVTYVSTSSNAAKIQQSIAKAGYDTPTAKATDEDYNKLHSCCKYDREASATTSCCDNDKCEASGCCKDGKCTGEMSCCKDSGCADKCKEGACSKKDCCKKA